MSDTKKDAPVYKVRKAKVKDLRFVSAEGLDSAEMPFILAERCISVDGRPITRDELDDMDLATFNGLLAEMNVGNALS